MKPDIDLSGIDTKFLTDKSLKVNLPKYRTFEWSDEVDVQKKLGRWKEMKRREEERLVRIMKNIEILEAKLQTIQEKEKENENPESQ